jgi:hypothetical protein
MIYVVACSPSFKFESSGVGAGLWPSTIWQLTGTIQQAIADGKYTLPLDASAAVQAGVRFSLHMEPDGSIVAEAHDALLQSMFPLTVTIVATGVTDTLTITPPAPPSVP